MNRIYHTWDKWECFPAGFYEDKFASKTKEECEREYTAFFRDLPRFQSALERVMKEWPRSCEHYLSNENMNRIAWLGQAAICISTGVPACFRNGFNRLSEDEQLRANQLALQYLNRWLAEAGESTLAMNEAMSKTVANLY